MFRKFVILFITFLLLYNSGEARSFYKKHFTRQERRRHIKEQKNTRLQVKKLVNTTQKSQ